METSTVRELSIGHTILGVFVITTVTVIIGMVTNRCAPVFARNFERIAKIMATVLFIVIIAGAIYAERDTIFVAVNTIGSKEMMVPARITPRRIKRAKVKGALDHTVFAKLSEIRIRETDLLGEDGFRITAEPGRWENGGAGDRPELNE